MLIKHGDIFLANFNLGDNCESQTGGIRPVIILQNNIANKYLPTTIIAPLTSRRIKASLPTHVSVSHECGLKKDSVILLEQISVIDKKRLLENVGHATDSIMERVNQALKIATAISSEGIQNNTESKMQNDYVMAYKDFYSSIKDVKDIKQILITSNYISNKVKDWILSGIIGAIIGTGLTLLIA